MLIGDAGCRKTTTINRLIVRLCSTTRLPLPIRLRLIRRGDSLRDVIARSMIDDLRGAPALASLRIKASEIAQSIEGVLSTIDVALLIDGLNEVPSELFHPALDMVAAAIEEYHWQRVLITDRTGDRRGLGKLDPVGAQILYHRGLSSDSAKHLIATDASMNSGAKSQLAAAIDKGGHFSSLLLNPQRLALSCRYLQAAGSLPSTVSQIFMEDLRRSSSASSAQDPPLDIRFRMLALIAAEMTSRGVLVADLLAPRLGIGEAIEFLCRSTEGSVQNWVRNQSSVGSAIAAACTGCPFVTLEAAQLSFVHQSYQDFLAGLWLYDSTEKLSSSDLERIIASPYWSEAIAFAVGGVREDTIRARLFDVMLATEDGVALAASCAELLPQEQSGPYRTRIGEAALRIAGGSPVAEMRALAMEVLARVRGTGLLEGLVRAAYSDPDWRVREMAALFAGTNLIAGSPPDILGLFADANEWVRAAAVWAAGELILKELTSELRRVAETDQSRVVRAWAAFALLRIGRPAMRDRNVPWYVEYIQSGVFPDCRGETVAASYIAGLSSTNEIVRSTSVEALSDMESYAAFSSMRRLCSDTSSYVRAWLMRSIGEAEVLACSDIILEGYRDADAWVRFWAATSAGRLRLRSHLSALNDLLHREEDPEVLRAIAWALSNTGSLQALEPLERLCASGRILWSEELRSLMDALRGRISQWLPFSLRHLRLWTARITGAPEEDCDLFLRRHEDEVTELATVFAQYQRPDGILMSPYHVRAWLRQFGSVERISYALRLLHQVHFYHRARMEDIFEAFMRSTLGPHGLANASVSILGNPSDSSSIVNYVIRDAVVSLGMQAQELRASLASGPKTAPIVFVDDNIGSGKQSVQIFREWLSIKARVLDEHHVAPLQAEEIKLLCQRKIYVLACIATSQGCNYLTKELRAMGLSVGRVGGFTMVDQALGCFHGACGVFGDRTHREAAKRMAQEIGLSLLKDKRWSEERKRQSALGYGGDQKLIVFFYNTPTVTLPILWKSGEYGGRSWFALFPRREKA